MEISFSGTYSLHYYQYIQTSSGLYNAFFRSLKTLELAQFHHLDTMVLQMQWQLFLSEAEIHFFNPRVNSTQFCSKWSKETLVRILSLILNLSVRYHSLKKKIYHRIFISRWWWWACHWNPVALPQFSICWQRARADISINVTSVF